MSGLETGFLVVVASISHSTYLASHVSSTSGVQCKNTNTQDVAGTADFAFLLMLDLKIPL